MSRSLFTSESVSMGHPDKVCDQISDAVLDAHLAQDPKARVACETLVTTGLVMLAGEITSKAVVDYQEVVRRTIREIGYTDAGIGFEAESCSVQVALHQQSPDIAQGVNEGEGLHKEQGAGDQGLMFGYACDETPNLMPLPVDLSHRLLAELTKLRQKGKLPYLRPDSKSQVTVEYDGDTPVRVHTVVISTQHTPKVSLATIRKDLVAMVQRVIPKKLLDKDTIYHINPTGRFEVGGPHGDAGLTGRKIIVDTYGGMGRHGGGAFSGKDPSKVDRSAAYAARWVAKHIVAAKLAKRCEIQLAYAIGVAQPVSIKVDSFGTGVVDDSVLAEAVQAIFDLTPKGIITGLNLLRPIYRHSAYHGHFGRSEFPWEQTSKVPALLKAVEKLMNPSSPAAPKKARKVSAKPAAKKAPKSAKGRKPAAKKSA
ncbi:MAG: methionine adenosyltransferase [Planctomycetota bacterium]|nr:MAG: methionine adenosyltransferase [Planctomycetota bacterium]